ncbi:MAG: lipase [Lachnospiraceae bacterium]|nr:lipase [Lachnospiraceae bacterium]
MRKRKRDGWYVLLMLFAMVGICWILQMKEVERQELSIQGGSAVLPENLVHLGNHSYRRVVTNGHIAAGELDGDMVVVREEEDISDPAQPGNVPVPEPVPEPGPGTSEVADPGDIPEPQVVVTIGTTDMAYFDDALFIGDSRTVGIAEYGYLENADYFADVSMTVFKLFTAKLSVDGGEKVSLETALTQKQYGKVYVMVGINELGHNREQAVAKFGELISLIETTQPGATIYICANLHVTESRSKTDAIINNDNINSYNKALSAFADGENKFYIDVNPVFDDMSGSLSEDYASDSAHMEAQHYDMWCDWLMEQAVVKTYQ